MGGFIDYESSAFDTFAAPNPDFQIGARAPFSITKPGGKYLTPHFFIARLVLGEQ